MSFNDKDSALEALKSMGHGDKIYINWHEEGGAEVHRIWDMYFLFEIPQYGGEGSFGGALTKFELDEIVDIAFSWT